MVTQFLGQLQGEARKKTNAMILFKISSKHLHYLCKEWQKIAFKIDSWLPILKEMNFVNVGLLSENACYS